MRVSHFIMKNAHFCSTENSILSKMCTKNLISKKKVEKIHRKRDIVQK